MNDLIRPFSDIRREDVAIVGGKNASLGEMIAHLSSQGIRVPDGFAITAYAFRSLLSANNLEKKLQALMDKLDRTGFTNLAETGASARELILQASMPQELADAILQAYRQLGEDKPVAVRSSATAEDLPQASFAGQHDSLLDVEGGPSLLKAVQQCFASLYTNRAIKYREDKGFDHSKVALSVGVQQMVHADDACSGIIFTLDPETGFRNVIHLSATWGLGENIVQGTVTPDEYYVFKPSLEQGMKAIVSRKLGDKGKTMKYTGGVTVNISTPEEKRTQYALTDEEVMQLANWALTIEKHYQSPMDIEWAKESLTGKLFILQARPETVHSQKPGAGKLYTILQKGECLASGEAVGAGIVSGKARVLSSPDNANELQAGDIIVTEITSPDWDPLLKKAAGIVTNKGGRTSHASIVARELGVPAVVGTGNGTENIKDGTLITVSCCEGRTGHVYSGEVKYSQVDIDGSTLQMPESTEVMLIAADPGQAFRLSFYPVDGVGLMRMEFIITHSIGIHPIALVHYNELQDPNLKMQIGQLTMHYGNKEQYFIERMVEGIATMAAAFYPKDVIVRFSDFKTNEYAHLLGGALYEPAEENPMLGFRGASRYYSDAYKQGFRLECAAIKKVREEMGLTNVKVMVPFCRTVEEGRKVVHLMKDFGLDRDADTSLEIYVMVEIPSNVLLAEEFSAIFDGFSIGSNDLTQLTLGIDRDSGILAGQFSEQDPAAMKMVAMAIEKAHAAGMRIGICGQAPSDFPSYAGFLVEAGINSISFNADAVFKGIENILAAERSLQFTVSKSR